MVDTKKDYVIRIDEMERVDKNRKLGRKENSILSQ